MQTEKIHWMKCHTSLFIKVIKLYEIYEIFSFMNYSHFVEQHTVDHPNMLKCSLICFIYMKISKQRYEPFSEPYLKSYTNC